METGRELPEARDDSSVETQLRRSEANFLHLLDASPDAIAVHRSNRIVYVNAAALRLLGYAREDIVGRSPFDFVSPRYRLLVAERILQTYVRHTVTSEIEERMLHASGREVAVEVLAVPILFEGAIATLVHIRDISARKQLETKLRAADRLANVGLIASSIAHEVKGPLTYALWNLDLVAERLRKTPHTPELDEVQRLVGTAREGVERAARVARDMKMFSGAERAGTSPVDVHRLLDACANLVRADMRGRVHLVRRYGDVPPALGNETRLAQVFLNLVANAVEATPEHADVPREVTLTTRAEGGRVLVDVSDDGPGIPEHLRELVFEPLYTTKAEGAGLGLAITRALVAEEQGTLELRSEVGRGTTFTVRLRAASRTSPRR
jgi:PAS domain S-box-containing protein